MGPYKVLEQCGLVAYRLQLLDILSVVHDVFHVSHLKKCLWVPGEAVEIEGLPLQPDLTYIEHPINILDEKERVTRNNVDLLTSFFDEVRPKVSTVSHFNPVKWCPTFLSI